MQNGRKYLAILRGTLSVNASRPAASVDYAIIGSDIGLLPSS